MGVTCREPNLVGSVYQILDMPYFLILELVLSASQFGAGWLVPYFEAQISY